MLLNCAIFYLCFSKNNSKVWTNETKHMKLNKMYMSNHSIKYWSIPDESNKKKKKTTLYKINMYKCDRYGDRRSRKKKSA